MEGRREVRIKSLSHRPVTNRDLKQEKSLFGRSLSKCLQLVVAAVSGSLTVRGKVKLLVSYFTVDVLCNEDHRPLPSYKTLTFKLKASAQYFP